ncbi:hypothetical protein ACFL3G_10115 [Planctomycetota bacterium]
MFDIQNKIIQKMTPSQKVEASMMLYHCARHCKAAWLRKIHPDWSERQINMAVREAFINARS